MPTIDLPYGRLSRSFEVPPQTTHLTIQEPANVISPDIFRQRLTEYLHHHPLDLSRVSIVIADKTRLCDYPLYLPVLLDVLTQEGADNVTLFIAYGTHAPQNDEESLGAYGESYLRYPVIHHDSTHAALFTERGTSSRGTPLRLRRDLLESSGIITFGAISHHYFAGFGGGRKLIFPGLGEREAIYANHSLFLDQSRNELQRGCQPGKLHGNPLAEDLAEVEQEIPAHLSLHGILNSHGNVRDLIVGAGHDCFQQACAQHAASCEVSTGTFDLVLASCGGYPKDINLIQAHKAIHNAAAFVRDGGTLIINAECPDGIGSKTFLPWFELPYPHAFSQLAANYEGNGGTALALREKTARIRIILLSELSEELCNSIGITKLSHEKIQRILSKHTGSLACIPNASLVVRSA